VQMSQFAAFGPGCSGDCFNSWLDQSGRQKLPRSHQDPPVAESTAGGEGQQACGLCPRTTIRPSHQPASTDKSRRRSLRSPP